MPHMLIRHRMCEEGCFFVVRVDEKCFMVAAHVLLLRGHLNGYGDGDWGHGGRVRVT